MIGLPKGGGLRLNLLEGEIDRRRVELVAYIGAEKQDDLYKIATRQLLERFIVFSELKTLIA